MKMTRSFTRPEEILVGAGYLNRKDRGSGEIVGVSRIVVHEDFDLRFRRGVKTKSGIGKPHDIALLVLDVPVVSIAPVAIPSDTMVDVQKHDSAIARPTASVRSKKTEVFPWLRKCDLRKR